MAERPEQTRSDLNAATAKIDEQVYLVNYVQHYSQILGDHATRARLAELFLFRAWTAQFGFRVFSTDAASSEKLIGETINSCRYLGLGVFEETHGFSVESELGSDFFALLDDRWQTYDQSVSSFSDSDRLPTVEIITALTKHLDLRDPSVTYQLSLDFMSQLEVVKSTARELGLLS